MRVVVWKESDTEYFRSLSKGKQKTLFDLKEFVVCALQWHKDATYFDTFYYFKRVEINFHIDLFTNNTKSYIC